MSYNILAKYYELFTNNDCDYNTWSQYLSLVLKSHGAVKGADIACGTGKMTRLLAQSGYKVVGIDSSVDMLNIARSQGRCNYVCQDMLNLELPSKVNFITCINDGVNYISPKDTLKLFQSVYNQLTYDGVFIFDVSSCYKLSTIIGNNVFYHDYDDVTCLWSNKLFADRVEMDIAMFSLQSDDRYVREDEQHVQFLHDHNKLIKQLEEVGFKVNVYENYTNNEVSETTQRITFIATRG